MLAGATAGATGLAVAELVSALLRGRVSPVLAVGEWVIKVTPGAVAERAISTVGQADKPLLVAGVVAAVLALSALAGVVMLRRRGVGTTLLMLLPLVAVLTGLTRPDARPVDVLPSLLGGVTGLAVALWLVPQARAVTSGSAAGGPTRRRKGGVDAVETGVRRLPRRDPAHAQVDTARLLR